MSQPRIFVSHSHQDDRFTRRLVADLTRAGADVWVDKVGINHGNFMQVIDEALGQCEWLVLVLTPNAIASEHVRAEVFAALNRVTKGYMRGVIPILAAPCEPATIPPMWDALHRYDATRRYRAALADVLRMIGLSLSNVDDLIAKAEVLMDLEQFSQAVPLLEHATRLAPDNLYAWDKLGYAHMELDQWQEALATSDRALRVKPDDALSWDRRACALAALGEYGDALKALDCTLALSPKDLSLEPTWWNLRAVVLNGLKRYGDALAALDRALALDSNDASSWDNKGNALRGLKRHEEAVAAYDHALALNPQYAEARRNKSYALRSIARKAQAQDAERGAQEFGA